MTDLSESRPVQVLDAALAKGRLPHGILLFGDNLDGLESVAHTLAGKLLDTEKPPREHPDFFSLRPANKMRQISVDDTRGVISQVQKTANQGGRKVAVVYEADRMRREAANAFLKTLEEPPADTTIVLLTTRPYHLLPTIRSRCMNMRLPTGKTRIEDDQWQQTRIDYRKWLENVNSGKMDKRKAADLVLGIYGLVTRFSGILKELSDVAWKTEKTNLPAGLADEQVDAIEAGFRKGLRARLLTEIEQETRDFALVNPGEVPSRQLARCIRDLESATGLLEVNFNEAAVFELFLLKSLRTWSGR